jgi:hypothetical protein
MHDQNKRLFNTRSLQVKALKLVRDEHWQQPEPKALRKVRMGQALTSKREGKCRGSENVLKLKSTFIWDVLPWRSVEVHNQLGGMYCLHHQGWKVRQTRNQQEAGSKQCAICLLLGVLFSVPPKFWWTYTGLHGITSQKERPFIVTDVGSWDPTYCILDYMGLHPRKWDPS